MRIGLIEFLLILAIASLTVGPRVALFVVIRVLMLLSDIDLIQ